jgi:adenylate kinase
MCRQCGATYHVTFSPPQKGDVCDQCGGSLYQRDDDTAETVNKRLDVYETQTRPLISWYEKQGVLVNINGNLPMEEVTAAIMKAIHDYL